MLSTSGENGGFRFCDAKVMKASWFTQPARLEDANVLRIGSGYRRHCPMFTRVSKAWRSYAQVAQSRGDMGRANWAVARWCGSTARGGDSCCLFDQSADHCLVSGARQHAEACALMERFRRKFMGGKAGAGHVWWRSGDSCGWSRYQTSFLPPPNDPMARSGQKCWVKTVEHRCFPASLAIALRGQPADTPGETDQGVVICDNTTDFHGVMDDALVKGIAALLGGPSWLSWPVP
jgi:hypothetical protein